MRFNKLHMLFLLIGIFVIPFPARELLQAQDAFVEVDIIRLLDTPEIAANDNEIVSIGTTPAAYRIEGYRILDADFTLDGTRLVTSHADGNVRLWNIDFENAHIEQDAGIKLDDLIALQVEISADGNVVVLATGSYYAACNTIPQTYQLEVWHPAAGLHEVISSTPCIETFALSSNAELIASTNSQTIMLWERADMTNFVQRDSQLESDLGRLTALEFSPDASQLAIGGCGPESIYNIEGFCVLGAFLLLNIRSEETIFEPVYGNGGPITKLRFSTDGNLIASATDEFSPNPNDQYAVHIWDTETGTMLKSIHQQSAGVNRFLAVGSNRQLVALYNYRTHLTSVYEIVSGQQIPFNVHSQEDTFVVDAVFASNDQQLLSINALGDIHLYDS